MVRLGKSVQGWGSLQGCAVLGIDNAKTMIAFGPSDRHFLKGITLMSIQWVDERAQGVPDVVRVRRRMVKRYRGPAAVRRLLALIRKGERGAAEFGGVLVVGLVLAAVVTLAPVSGAAEFLGLFVANVDRVIVAIASAVLA
jgi:hypothetical protein